MSIATLSEAALPSSSAETIDPVPELTPQEREALKPELEFVRRIPIRHADESLENEPVEVLR